jgi:hypothetical protein
MTESPLDLDEKDDRRFRYAASNYGVEIAGCTPENRQAAIETQLDTPIATVDCRAIDSTAGFTTAALRAVGLSDSELAYIDGTGHIELQDALTDADVKLAVLEFDSLPESVQTDVARHLKGLAEALTEADLTIAYTASEAGIIVAAEPDLRARIQTFTVD